MTPEQAAALRAPFPPEAIGKLPKAGIKLDYVGHAGVTDRLLAVDPEWTWEPAAVNEFGVPLITAGGLWIKLTVCGVTRFGWGDGPDIKQMISDAIRNAAMRFGVALDLWSKEDLRASDENAEGRGQATTDATSGEAERVRDDRPSAISPAVEVREHSAAANDPESSSPSGTPGQLSAVRITDLQARAISLGGDGVDIKKLRTAWHLPPIATCDAKQLDLWDEMLRDEEKKLTAPFETASA